MSPAAGDKPVNPSNLIGLDYRRVPQWAVDVPLFDVHTHVRTAEGVEAFFEAAAAYGVRRVLSMQSILEAPRLRERWGRRVGFIAVPRWAEFALTDAFSRQWRADLAEFRDLGATLCKFWVAPPMRDEHGLTLDHPFMEPIIAHALDLGYSFMVHVGDPTLWWNSRYADTARFGTKRAQYQQLEHLLRRVSPRLVIGAHMGGTVEVCDLLQELFDRHPNYVIDTSATKWVVREVSRHPQRVRELVIRNADRVLFGSDCVTEPRHDFDHYASRYWAQRTLWETAHDGLSPIEDPDAVGAPLLRGVNLPPETLRKVYAENAIRLGLDA